jgi:16S rRNA (adenine1518-N6/adenine1519-N6)-dimethyltransferase
VRAAFDVASVMRVSAGSFFPRPSVESTVVALVPRKDRIGETPVFRALVHGAFQQRRKTLRNAWHAVADDDVLKAAAMAAHISLDARGETLSVEQFAAMALELSKSPFGVSARKRDLS